MQPLIQRPRLIDAVRRGLSYGVMIIAAPRGSGKRTLLGQIDEPHVRVELTARTGPSALATAVARAALPGFHDAPASATLAQELRDVEGPIVIDGVHRLDDEACGVLSALIDATAPRTRWLLAGDGLPVAIATGSWIERRWMTLPLASDDLAFNIEETAELATANGLHLTLADAEHIRDAVDGWATGIVLQMEALLRGHSVGATRLACVSELLATHLLPTLDDTEHAIVTLLTIGGSQDDDTLAEIIGRREIDEILTRIPLLQRSGRTTIVHETLAASIRAHAPRGTLSKFGEALATRYIAQGNAAAALRLAHGLRIPTLILRVIELAVLMLIDTEQALLREVVDALPGSSTSLPTVRAIRGLLAERADHFAVAEPILRRLEALPEPLAAAVALSRGRLATMRGDFETGLADVAAYVHSRDPLVAVDAGLRTCFSLAKMNRREDARPLITILESQIDELPVEYQAAMLLRLSMISYYFAEYQKAEAVALRAVDLARNFNDMMMVARSKAILFAAAQWTSELPVLQQYVDDWLTVARGIDSAPQIAMALCTAASLAAERGDFPRYRELAAQCRATRRALPPEWDFALRWANSMVEIAEGHPRQAAATMAPFKDSGSSSEALARALEAFALVIAGETRDAHRALARIPAAALSNSDADLGLRAIYAASFKSLALWMLDHARAARGAFPAFLPHQIPARDRAVVAAMLAICNTPRTAMTKARLELLTEPIVEAGVAGHALLLRNGLQFEEPSHQFTAEALAVFQDLAIRGGTSRDVASRLKIAPSTVDWHVKQVCRRTGTSGRAAALRYLSERGFL